MRYDDDLLCDPAELEGIDPARIAHLCIDMQENCFAPAFEGDPRQAEVRDVGDRIVRLAQAFKDAGVGLTKYVAHKLDKDAFASPFYIVQPEADEIFLKPRFSSFLETNLHEVLQEKGIETLILSGGYTICCVAETAKDGLRRGYKVFALADCVLDYSERPYSFRLKYSFMVPSLFEESKRARFTEGETVLRAFERFQKPETGIRPRFVSLP